MEAVNCRLLQCFTHVYREDKYVFLVVKALRRQENVVSQPVIDTVLALQSYILAIRPMIYGLPVLRHEHPYFVEVPTGVATEIDEELSGQTVLLKCDWNLAFL